MSNISIFPNAYATVPSETMSMDTFLEGIKLGRWRTEVEAVRACTDKESRDDAKRSVPCVTASGSFTARNQQSMVAHSGYLCIDVDTECDRSALVRDPYTYALFDSVSQQGVAIIVRVVPDRHSESFDYLQRYYYETYGLVIDPKPRNIVSLRFVSYDPHLYLNTRSRISKVHTKTPKPPKSMPIVYTGNELDSIVRAVRESGASIAESYEDYLNLSFALADELGESGRTYFHSLASASTKYSPDQADRQYNTALRREPGSRRVTIGTFYHMVKQAGVTLPKPNSQAITIATTAKSSGADTKSIAELLITQAGLAPTQASNIAKSVLERSDITLSTVSSDPEHLIETLMYFLTSKYPLRRNLVTHKIEFTKDGRILQEEDINDLYLHARSAFNTPNVTKDLIQSIIFSNHTKPFHPILDFIDKHASIKPSGTIDSLISCIHTKTPHASTWIRKWLIGIHAAIDGHPVRSMLVFTGPQYNGKTEFFRRLLPTQLRSYYAESKLDRGKDDELLMCQKLIVMDDEMGGKSKQDEKRLKELTSKETFSLRAPYRKDNMDYKRLAILCGTSNPTEIINDPTGNTRILPVKVDSIEFDKINLIDRTEVFMEAYHAYKAGESWQLTRDEVTLLNTVSDDFSSICYERELILQFFAPADGSAYTDYLTATEIKNEIEVNTKQQIRNMGKFSIELRNIFGDPKPKKKGRVTTRCFSVIKVGASSSGGVAPKNYSEDLNNQPIPF